MRNSKLVVMAVAMGLMLGLSGCSVFSVDNGLLSFTTSAQTKLADVLNQGDKDLTLATTLAASDKLNVPAAAQCLPVFQTWYNKLGVQLKASVAAGNAGAATTAVKYAWATGVINGGVPTDVQLACGAFANQLDADATNVVDLVVKIVK